MTGETLISHDNDERRGDKELRYSKWLEQVTINAVEQALRLLLVESHHQTDVQGPSSSSRSAHSSSSRQCSRLELNSDERRTVAARIFSLLVQWKPDLSFEWRARVAASVDIFEQAMYHEAKSKEEYMNPLMLDLQLRQVLRHFEAGTGPYLLRKQLVNTSSVKALTKSVSFNSALDESWRQPIALRDLMKMQDEESSEDELLPPKAGETGVAEGNYVDMLRRDVQNTYPLAEKAPVSREEADGALWEAILTGNLKELEEGLRRHREHASKRVVKRVIGLVSKKKRDLEVEVKKMPQQKKVTANPGLERHCASLSLSRGDLEEKKGLCADADGVLKVAPHSQGKLEESVHYGGHPGKNKVRRGRENAAFSLEEISSRIQAEICQATDPEFSGTKESTEDCLNGTACSEASTPILNTLASTSDNSCINSQCTETEEAVIQEGEMQGLISSVSCDRSIETHQNPSVHPPTHIRTVSLRERRVLGSLLTEARGEHGWLPLGRTTLLDLLPNPTGRCRSHFTCDRANVNPAIQNEMMLQDSLLNPSEQGSNAESITSLAAADSLLQTPRVSLMTLLHQEGDPESVFVLNRRRVISDSMTKSCEEFGEGDGGMDPICCVCMVGKKGAAFIPCGHTFCRKCTRELRKGRGTCPLCNRRIQEVLRIY